MTRSPAVFAIFFIVMAVLIIFLFFKDEIMGNLGVPLPRIEQKPAGAVHNRQTEIDALVAPEKRHFNRALVSLVNAFVFGAIIGALACYLILKQ